MNRKFTCAVCFRTSYELYFNRCFEHENMHLPIPLFELGFEFNHSLWVNYDPVTAGQDLYTKRRENE